MQLRRVYLLLPLLAFVCALPLLTGGCSCGHDFEFHLQSWMDAAEQFRHGTLHPHWAFSAAYNAGEPRFVFYPPVSWTLGALLTLLLPLRAVPATFTLLALALSAVTMFRLARRFFSPGASVLAAATCIANPYLLFTAFERTAYAELLAVAWLPLLLDALLSESIQAERVALPVALLWLTNAPAAVIGCYTAAIIVLVRAAVEMRGGTTSIRGRAVPALAAVLRASGGITLGIGLAAFYIVPAAYERRYVQIAMAVIPNMRVQDNFLFGHTGDSPHDSVLRTVSLIAVALLCAACAALAVTTARGSTRNLASGQSRLLLAVLSSLTVWIGLLLAPASLPVWKHLPELAFLQFPWRWLSVLAIAVSLGFVLALRSVKLKASVALTLAALLAGGAGFAGMHAFRQSCADDDLPAARQARFTQHLGVEPTDEYTPNNADNDVLRANDPPYWLTSDPQSFAPGTTPNPATHPEGQSALQLPLTPQSAGTHEPVAIHAVAPAAEFLVLNLRAYPNWEILVNHQPALPYRGDPRDDGLIVVPVRAGVSDIEVSWRQTPDQWTGAALSAAAAAVYALLLRGRRSRRIERSA